MKPIFYTRIPIVYEIMLYVLFAMIIAATLGLGWCLNDFFTEHKYWLNRRVLSKYLKSKDLKYTKSSLNYDITEYKFEDFSVWVWNKNLELTVSMIEGRADDTIGLFTSSKFEDLKVIQIIRQLNKLE